MSYLLAVETEVQSSSVDFRAVKGATLGFAPRTLLLPALSAPSLVAPPCQDICSGYRRVRGWYSPAWNLGEFLVTHFLKYVVVVVLDTYLFRETWKCVLMWVGASEELPDFARTTQLRNLPQCSLRSFIRLGVLGALTLIKHTGGSRAGWCPNPYLFTTDIF